MYKLVYSIFNSKPNSVQRLTDNTYIPFDEQNTDYQEYLKWLQEGNIPQEPDKIDGAV